MRKPIAWDFQSPSEYRKNLSNGDVLTKTIVASEVTIGTQKLGTCYSGFNESIGDEICRKLISKSR